MFERMSGPARRAIFHARDEALTRGAPKIEPTDLVLGLCRDVHQSDSQSIDLHEKEASFRDLFGRGAFATPVSTDKNIGLSKTSKLALAYACEEAEKDHVHSIDSEHLLRGVLRTEDEAAAKLTAAGYSLASLREAAKQHLRSEEALPLENLRRILLAIVLILVVISVFFFFSQK
jgi:ATP-dependent Clp protease ATP-binding subunit ClpA